jgi:hypothetical protein
MTVTRILSRIALYTMISSTPMSATPAPEWTYEMGWRYVKYQEADGVVIFSIEPMVAGADVVHVPDRARWKKASPAWAKDRSAEIVERLRSVKWHRNLHWTEVEVGSFLADDLPIPGSLESTPGGRQIESYRLFHPSSTLTHEQAHEVWHISARRFAEAARGRVTIFANQVDPRTVFGAIELPALRANPNVTLDWKQ